MLPPDKEHKCTLMSDVHFQCCTSFQLHLPFALATDGKCRHPGCGALLDPYGTHARQCKKEAPSRDAIMP